MLDEWPKASGAMKTLHNHIQVLCGGEIVTETRKEIGDSEAETIFLGKPPDYVCCMMYELDSL